MDSGQDIPANLGNRRMGWGSDVVAETVRALGIEYIALVPGASFRGFHDSIVNYLGNESPQMVVCLHEQHAVSIADGYGKTMDRPMAAALHSNVGLMHATVSIFNAWCARSPVVVFGATGPVDAHIRRPWIDWLHTSKDQGALVRDYVKWDDQPASPEAAVESVLRAHQIASTAPFGPVYVCLDVGMQETELKNPVKIPPVDRFRPAEPPAPSAEQVKAVRAALQNAKSPVVLIGRVSRDEADWARRIKFAEAIGAPVMTTVHHSVAFPTEHPLHIRPMSGERPNKDDAELINKADLIVSLDWMDLAGFLRTCSGEAQTQNPTSAKVVHVSLDSYLANGWSMFYQALPAIDQNILADPDVFIEAFLDELDGATMPRRLPAGITHWTEAQAASAPPSGTPLTKADLARAYVAATEGRNVTLARACLGWPGTACHFDHPLDYLGKDAGGAVGSGPGHSVGVALALKESGRAVVSVLGDGDYLMGANALWTAARMRLPLMVIVANNRSYFNDEAHQERMAVVRNRPVENKWIGQRIDDPAPDVAGFARAQGFEAETVETYAELEKALARGLDHVAAGHRFVLDVRIGGS